MATVTVPNDYPTSIEGQTYDLALFHVAQNKALQIMASESDKPLLQEQNPNRPLGA